MLLNNKIILANFSLYIFLSFPLIVIIGVAAVNIYFFSLLILSLLGYFTFTKKIKLQLFEKILIIFVIYIILTNIFYLNIFGFQRILNLIIHVSIFLLLPRFVKLDLINLRFYFKLLTILIFLIIFDTHHQHILGFNIFGVSKIENRLTSFFIDEAIVGTYLSYFSIIVFLYLSFKVFRSKKFLNQSNLFFLFSTVGLYTIIITGERMASLMYFLILILVTFLLKIEIRKFIPVFFVLILGTLLLIPKNIYKDRFLRGLSDTIYIKSLSKYSTVDINHKVLVGGFQSIKCWTNEFNYVEYSDRLIIKQLDLGKEKKFIECRKRANKYINDLNEIFYNSPKGFISSPIGKIFNSSLLMIKKNFFTGIGVKKYRLECNKYQVDILKSCSTHPHNYYLELLVETGFIGLIIFITFLFIFFNKFLKIYKYKNDYLIHILYLSQICMFFILFWPIKTSGSFFASYNSSFIWFNLILLNLILMNSKKSNV